MMVKVDVDGSPVQVPPAQVKLLPGAALATVAANTATASTITVPSVIRSLILSPSFVFSRTRGAAAVEARPTNESRMISYSWRESQQRTDDRTVAGPSYATRIIEPPGGRASA